MGTRENKHEEHGDTEEHRGPLAPTIQLQREILALLHLREAGKTICPSEVARSVAGTGERTAWEPLMGPVREAAQQLVVDRKLVVTQRGQVVDGRTVKGPIRLRLR